MNEKYGLVGFPLGHSLSPLIHGEIFKITGHEGEYSLYEIKPDEFDKLSSLDGFNVTIPYKETIIPYCESLDDSAACGAVNCVRGKVGYNTDVFGFRKSVEVLGASLNSRVLLLGHGGAGKMVAHEVEKANGNLTIATPENINSIEGDFDLVINATPVGMYPNVDQTPLDFGKITATYLLDLVYNPAETKLMSLARQAGVKVMNGLIMLVWQAIKSHEIWYGGKVSDSQAVEIIETVGSALMRSDKLCVTDKSVPYKPILLYGFMGCGKSCIGRKIAQESGLSLVDLDESIGNIPRIFAEHGEEYFRGLEFTALKSAKADIIALGGGALTSPKAAAFARENALVIFIDTPFDTCYERVKNDKSRPLAFSKSKAELLALYESRKEHYINTADYIVKDVYELRRTINDYLQR